MTGMVSVNEWVRSYTVVAAAPVKKKRKWADKTEITVSTLVEHAVNPIILLLPLGRLRSAMLDSLCCTGTRLSFESGASTISLCNRIMPRERRIKNFGRNGVFCISAKPTFK